MNMNQNSRATFAWSSLSVALLINTFCYISHKVRVCETMFSRFKCEQRQVNDSSSTFTLAESSLAALAFTNSGHNLFLVYLFRRELWRGRIFHTSNAFAVGGGTEVMRIIEDSEKLLYSSLASLQLRDKLSPGQFCVSMSAQLFIPILSYFFVVHPIFLLLYIPESKFFSLYQSVVLRTGQQITEQNRKSDNDHNKNERNQQNKSDYSEKQHVRNYKIA